MSTPPPAEVGAGSGDDGVSQSMNAGKTVSKSSIFREIGKESLLSEEGILAY